MLHKLTLSPTKGTPRNSEPTCSAFDTMFHICYGCSFGNAHCVAKWPLCLEIAATSSMKPKLWCAVVELNAGTALWRVLGLQPQGSPWLWHLWGPQGPGLLQLLKGRDLQRQKRAAFLPPSMHKWGLTLSLEQHIRVPWCLQSVPETVNSSEALSIYILWECGQLRQWIHTHGKQGIFHSHPLSF